MNYSENGVKKKAEALRCRSVRISKKVQVLFLRLGFLLLIGAFFYMSYLGYRYMHSMIDEVPNVKTIELVPTGKPTLILDDGGETVRTLTADDINRSYTMLDQMPRNLQNAFIAIEDSSFRSHKGIDSVGTLKAFVTGLTNGGNFSQSSTTITQQLL
ncbi:MAG: transglycosylase domain-containing protein, partial [Eubacterium sp.]|nr:transglycosylase domain-containing protein [Eubacterium sp.]